MLIGQFGDENYIKIISIGQEKGHKCLSSKVKRARKTKRKRNVYLKEEMEGKRVINAFVQKRLKKVESLKGVKRVVSPKGAEKILFLKGARKDESLKSIVLSIFRI